MKILRAFFITTIVASLPDCVTATLNIEMEEGIEVPGIFGWDFVESKNTCVDNAIVAGWCDGAMEPLLKCAIRTDFDEYGCSCHGNAAACPSECVGGSVPSEKTHFEIKCVGIPKDEPNYILKEGHAPQKNHCENNAVVAGWCDEFVSPGLKCSLLLDKDEYVCSCHDNPAACPTDCIGGTAPISREDQFPKFQVHCKGIPIDQPNYELKGGLKEVA